MYGRFVQCATGERLAARFQFVIPPALAPRYNVAPSQPVGAIRAAEGGREWATLRWGLVPDSRKNIFSVSAYQIEFKHFLPTL